jgi:peptidoglycan hydrolase CwlO-like protein
MLEEIIPLTLLVVWIGVLFSLTRRKTTIGIFTAASGFLAFFIIFFSLGNAITEVSISSIGKIKTNAETDLKEIETIKAKIQNEEDSLNAEIAKLRVSLGKSHEEIQNVTSTLAPSML